MSENDGHGKNEKRMPNMHRVSEDDAQGKTGDSTNFFLSDADRHPNAGAS